MAPEQPAYRTPGALIRTAREAKGMSLEDLAAETRIPDRLLAAMERDDFDQLSGALYARSFLRNCAQVLGRDPSVLLDAYERMLTEQDPEIPPDQTWETETEVQRIGAVPWRSVGLAAGGLALLALLVWGGIAVFGGGGPEAEPVEPAMSGNTTTVAADLDAATPDSLATGTLTEGRSDADPGIRPGTDPDAEDDGATEPNPASRNPVAAEVEPRSDAAPAPDDADDALPVGDSRLVFAGGETWPLVLRVVLERRTDLAVGSDGDREAQPVPWPARPVYGVPAEDVEPGRLYAMGGHHVAYWGAADHFLLKLSSAEGVSITLNGRPLEIPPRSVGREWVLDRTRIAP